MLFPMVSQLRSGEFLPYSSLITLLWSEEGATAIEYGIIGAAISVAIAAALFLFGDQLQIVLQSIVDIIIEVNATLS